MYSLMVRWINLAALSWRFHILVEETISSSLRVGNCFLNLMSICSCSFRKSSDSSTCPRTCLTSECRMSRQWILLPFAIGRLKLTNATMLGFDIPRGGSRLAMKSLNCEKFINCVACGSYLRNNRNFTRVRTIFRLARKNEDIQGENIGFVVKPKKKRGGLIKEFITVLLVYFLLKPFFLRLCYELCSRFV